jgi:hypothetical protein
MDLISISTTWSSQIHYNNGNSLPRTLVIIEVISEFYSEKTLIKEIFFGAGPSRAGRALIIAGPLWAGLGHEKVTPFEPCCG